MQSSGVARSQTTPGPCTRFFVVVVVVVVGGGEGWLFLKCCRGEIRDYLTHDFGIRVRSTGLQY